MLRSIQLARGLAALAVAFHHLFLVQNKAIGHDHLGFASFLSFGYAGVDLFFVISGFIIAFITDRGEFRPSEFFMRRAIRILPVYWIFTILTWIGLAFIGKGDFTAWRIFASFAVLPQLEEPIAGVGWSLEPEVIFYVVFGLTAATIGRRHVIPVLCLLCLIGLVNVLFYQAWDWRLFSLFFFEFMAGVALYEHRHLLERFNPGVLVALGLLGFPATQLVIEVLPGITRVLGFAVSSVLLLGGLLELEPRLGCKSLSPLVKLGDASFVLYLSHPIFLSGAAWFWQRANSGEALLLPTTALALVVSIVFSLLFHAWCERPLIDALHQRLLRKHDPPKRGSQEMTPDRAGA